MKLWYLIILLVKFYKAHSEYYYPEQNPSKYSFTVYKNTRTSDANNFSIGRHSSYRECIAICYKSSFCKSIGVQDRDENTVDCLFFVSDILKTWKEKGYLFITQIMGNCSQSCSLTRNPCGKCKCYPSCSSRNSRQYICNCTDEAGEAISCQTHYNRGFNQTAVYKINPSSNAPFFTICEMSKNDIQNNVRNCLFTYGQTVLGDENRDTYPFSRKCTQFCIKEKVNGKTEINLIRWKDISCECVNGSVADNFDESGVKYCMLGDDYECQFKDNKNILGKTVSKLQFSNDLCVPECIAYSVDNPSNNPSFILQGVDVEMNANLCKCIFGDSYHMSSGSTYSWCVFQLQEPSRILPSVSVWIPMMTRFSSWEADFWKKDYQSYKNGFGLVNQHWIGLENLHQITKVFKTNMRIDYSFHNGNTISTVYIEIKVDTEENHYQFNYKSYDDRSSGEIDRFNAQGAYFQNCSNWWSYTCQQSSSYPTSVPDARFSSKVNLLWIKFLLQTY